jgi:hypothetical protein
LRRRTELLTLVDNAIELQHVQAENGHERREQQTDRGNDCRGARIVHANQSHQRNDDNKQQRHIIHLHTLALEMPVKKTIKVVLTAKKISLVSLYEPKLTLRVRKAKKQPTRNTTP